MCFVDEGVLPIRGVLIASGVNEFLELAVRDLVLVDQVRGRLNRWVVIERRELDAFVPSGDSHHTCGNRAGFIERELVADAPSA